MVISFLVIFKISVSVSYPVIRLPSAEAGSSVKKLGVHSMNIIGYLTIFDVR